MVEITPLDEKDSESMKDFGAREWPSADKEHFGNQKVDFAKRKLALVAREGDVLVGYITLILDMGVLHLESLLVAEKFRGQGIASMLVKAAEEAGREMGAHKIWLETGSDWKARGVYRKLGYVLIAELPDFYAHRDFIMMGKAL